MIQEILKNYYKIPESSFVLTNRAFTGLYSLFCCIRRITHKRKILFTSNTCATPVFAALFSGFTPEFTDIDLKDFLMDSLEAEDKLKNGADIAALVYIYIYGHTSRDIFHLKTICEGKGIFLIEDVAQAFGGTIDGVPVGSIGDSAVMSFGYSKQIDCGGGGTVINNSGKIPSKDISEELRKITYLTPPTILSQQYRTEFYALRHECLKSPENFKKYLTFPEKYRALYFMKNIPDWNLISDKLSTFIKRKSGRLRFDKALMYLKCLSKVDKQIHVPVLNAESSLYRFSFLAEDNKDAEMLSKVLRFHEINCSNLYIPVSLFFASEGFHRALSLARRVINLWVDDSADENYIQKTCFIINRYYAEKK